MNLNCSIQLFRYNDDSLSSNNVTSASVHPNNIDISNTIKRSTRIIRKRTIHDKSILKDNDDQSVNIKKKKRITKKSLPSKNDSEKSSILPKDTKKLKNPKLFSIKSSKNNSINSDNSKMPNATTSENFYKDGESTNSVHSSLKTLKNKTFKSISSNKKKSVINRINKIDMSNVFKRSNDLTISKSPKKKSKCTTSIKDKSVVNNVDKDDILKKIEQIDNISSKMLNNKTSKSSAYIKTKIENKHDTSPKNDDLICSQKRGRITFKKVQTEKNDISVYSNDINSQKNNSWSVVLNKLNNVQEPQIYQKIDDNTMMLRSNSKPPKIKKKWSDEWSGNKVSNLLKSNNNDFISGQKIEVNKCKSIKKVVKNHKPKNGNHKKLKTKILEQLNAISDCSILTNDSNICDTVESINESTSIPETQNHNSVLITNSIPSSEQIINDNNIAEPINIEIGSNNSCTIGTANSSEVVTTPFTDKSENVLSSDNYQPSNFKSSESINDSNYLSVPIMNSECPEISYGISILSEAISRQCNELANKNNEIKSLEHDINEQKSPKNTNINLRLQVPSAVVSPQKICEDMSKKVIKSELHEQSFEKELQSYTENEILILSKRFNIPINSLKKITVEEPLSVFEKQYIESINSSMLKITPITTNIKSRPSSNANYISTTLDVKYNIETIKDNAVYEKTNLKDLMEELTKTMPSWSLNIVSNPPRYIISHISVNTYGIPIVNKSIVLDEYFRASVYINQCLKYTYCKPYSTAIEIVNLIKELHSL